MPWSSARPQENWKPREMWSFLRELWSRPKFGTFTWDPPSIAATTTTDTMLSYTTVPALEGLRAGMPVFVTPPAGIDNGILVGGAWVATDNTLTIRLRNTSGASIDLPSATWGFVSFIV